MSSTATPTWKLLGIMEHPSYHGGMSGIDAESKLLEQNGDYYLTRYSEARCQYTLTVARNGVCAHFDLIITSSGQDNVYEIDGSEMQSKDIFALLDFYKSNPLSHTISGVGEVLLKDPAKALVRQSSNLPDGFTKVFRKRASVSNTAQNCAK